MPKKIKFESFKYRLLMAAQDSEVLLAAGPKEHDDFLNSLAFSYQKGSVIISWKRRAPGEMSIDVREAALYTRGDTDQSASQQVKGGMLDGEDPIKVRNDAYFRNLIAKIVDAAGYASDQRKEMETERRFDKEREFHDEWAEGEDIDGIDVRTANEACTAPEMRYIIQRLGDLSGKRLLDVGCGLGEASVYFALRGADVTSSDLSPGMLEATCRLAMRNGVKVTPHVSAAEDLKLPSNAQFDVIYAGNLLHHVDIDETLKRLFPHLAPNGLLVTWDPLAYNPAINVYRSIATSVRTPDEHPLTWSDIRLFKKHFKSVETRYFWLTTLLVFIFMVYFQRRDPNKERLWKVVVKEGHKWQWIYKPLETLDRLLLTLAPPLRLLCWNVVIVATR
jgi:2-polyprenyl-3-methyl-5-hydroxy-6-metoxy-1,4-benzoquinol methylase